MPSLCIQSVHDLFTIPCFTLPYGDKNDRPLGQENCTRWISTVASTTLAVGFFFTSVCALKTCDFVLENLAEKFDAYEHANFFSFIARNGILWVLSKIYIQCDFQASALSCVASNVYFGIQSYQASKYHLCGMNALFISQVLRNSDNTPEYRCYGVLKRHIRRFAENYAPTMAACYGYRSV